jgi:hypothetical protein
MGKFGNLSGAADGTFRVRLLDRKTDRPIKDQAGEEAWIDVIYSNSTIGRMLDVDIARERAALGKRDTQLELNIMKLARMTKGWHLVDPVTREAIDVSPTVENAEEFYLLPLASDFFVQAWVASHAAENFMPDSPKN